MTNTDNDECVDMKTKSIGVIITLFIFIFISLITFGSIKLVYMGKQPKPISRLEQGIELKIENEFDKSFYLEDLEFTPKFTLWLSIDFTTRECELMMQEGEIFLQNNKKRISSLSLSKRIKLSEDTLKRLQNSNIASQKLDYALLGGLFDKLTDKGSKFSISLNEQVSAHAWSLYDVKPKQDGFYEIFVQDLWDRSYYRGSKVGGAVFKGKTDGKNDVIASIINLLFSVVEKRVPVSENAN